MKTYKIRLTFTEPLLGTVPKDPDVYAAHIATKAALTDELVKEELETVEYVEQKGWTGFHQVDGTSILYDYVIKGFFKDACGMLRRSKKTRSSKILAYKKIIDGMVFPSPRRIPINLSGKLEVLERPLRAQTAQGERITVTRSDCAPIGSTIEFDLLILGGVSKILLEEWLTYGQLRGLGQWRNGGYGSFAYEIEDVA